MEDITKQLRSYHDQKDILAEFSDELEGGMHI